MGPTVLTIMLSVYLKKKDIRSAIESVIKCLNNPSVSKVLSREKYNAYTPEQRAQVGKYAAENGPARATRHFSTLWNMTVPESSVRRLKTECLQKVKEVSVKCEENEAPAVASLPTKPQGRPLMLGKMLDPMHVRIDIAQNFIIRMWPLCSTSRP